MDFAESNSPPELLRLGTKIAVLPVIHGSAQFAVTVRKWMLEYDFDCVAIPLPESFREDVEQAVLRLPKPSIVIQRPGGRFATGEEAVDMSKWGQTASNWDQPWTPDSDSWNRENSAGGSRDGGPPEDDNDAKDNDAEEESPTSYVPVEPCQAVIVALRAAMGEHIPRAFIDLETRAFRPFATGSPDPFALRHVGPEKFAAAMLPSIMRPPERQTLARIDFMAHRLAELERRHDRILFVCSVLMWPWIREAYTEKFCAAIHRTREAMPESLVPDHEATAATEVYGVDPRTGIFLFGELPFITGLYQRAHEELDEEDDLQIDGVKELLIAARDSYRDELGNRARRITPLMLSKCLTYIRNLSLIHRRMTPDLVTIVTAAKQVMGDGFAIHVAEHAREYPYNPSPQADESLGTEESLGTVTLGIDQARLPDGESVALVSRLPVPPLAWKTLELKRRPTPFEQSEWQYQWNPYQQCSYPPEDVSIELFRSRVFENAEKIISNGLARTEKFTTSVKDGIDIRDTLRHWHEREIYVKVCSPNRGKLDACVMLFDSPADPRDYPWRTTWFAEHDAESTLAFFATDFQAEMVGPGIGLGTYGGAMFLFPPEPIPDVWSDKRLDFTATLEERLIAAAALHGRSRQVAILSALPPGAGLRRLARRFKKQLVHVPMALFGDEQVQQLRMVHVLNGGEIRSFAEHFIRKA